MKMENEKYNFRNILRNFHADFHADAFVNGSGQIGRGPETRQKKDGTLSKEPSLFF